MKSLGKVLTIATLSAGFALSVAPKASACGVTGVINQPAVIDQLLVQPAVIDSCNTTLTAPAVIDTGMCNSCGLNTLVQPAVIDSSYALPPVMYYGGFRRHHLLGLDTPFFGLHVF